MKLPLEEEANEFTATMWRRDLARYSMIRLGEDDDAFTIHGLVQAVERRETAKEDRPRMIERATKLFMAWAPTDTTDVHNWPVWRLMEPHARALLAASTAGDPVRIDVGFLDCLGNYLRAAEGAYSDAELMLLLALEGVGQALGSEHLVTLMSMNNLGLLYESQGRYDEAQRLYERILFVRQRALGENHEETLEAMNSLAGLYESQGR
jgi:hypothetical protein